MAVRITCTLEGAALFRSDGPRQPDELVRSLSKASRKGVVDLIVWRGSEAAMVVELVVVADSLESE
jgi:hypothetical protein